MENIMKLPNKQQIKIIDFGLSNNWTPDCPLRTHCGSPEYAAPELFLIGRHYGPKVDLWSLGVILYGMVTGRLPFVNTRHEAMTVQEKRQKLLAQIKRGLTNVHKKDLQNLSPDFNHLMANLLVPNVSARIDTETLLSHPWVTNRQRKTIRVNTAIRMNSSSQAIIVADIAKMLQTDSQSIICEIKRNRFGEIGGMYNIKKYVQITAGGIKNEPPLMSCVKNVVKSGSVTSRSSPIQATNSTKVIDEKFKILKQNQSIDNRKRHITSKIPQNVATINPPSRILSPPTNLIKNNSMRSCHVTPRQPQMVSYKIPKTDDNQRINQMQVPSIPKPFSTCPLHSKLNTRVQYFHNNKLVPASNKCVSDGSKVIGTFQQSHATVHPKIATVQKHEKKQFQNSSKNSPTSTATKINTKNRLIEDCGDPRRTEKNLMNGTNPIVKSISTYLRNIKYDTKLQKLIEKNLNRSMH